MNFPALLQPQQHHLSCLLLSFLEGMERCWWNFWEHGESLGFNIWLVVLTIWKHMSSSMGRIIPIYYGNITNDGTHQPDMLSASCDFHQKIDGNLKRSQLSATNMVNIYIYIHYKYMCMYVHIYVCMYVCIYICIYVCTYIYICMYVGR